MTNYIGRNLDKISNIEILDNITFDGSQSYTLQKGGVNFTPNSAQSIILGIDGITQIGNFSVNGSTIDFGVAVASSSTCNYIIHLGTGILTAPSDGSVTNAKLGTAPTLEAKGSGGTAGGVKYFCEQGSHGITLRSPQHSAYSGSYELVLPTAQGSANTFLKNDGSGNLSFAAAEGITMVDQFRLNAAISGANHVINANWERPDTGISAQFGSIQMSQSSGIFTFPSTGFYKIDFIGLISYGNVADNMTIIKTQITTDNSNYSDYAEALAGSNSSSGNSRFSVSSSIIVDITDTTNQKCRFSGSSFQSSNVVLEGDSSINKTVATFTRIGDT